MALTSCPSCGATVQVGQVINSTERVPLEVNEDSSTDAKRYRIVLDNPLTIERVPDDAPGSFYADHRFDCPEHNAGRTT
jgi:hypothetical protein